MKERRRDGKEGGEEGETEEVGVEGKQERGKEGRRVYQHHSIMDGALHVSPNCLSPMTP